MRKALFLLVLSLAFPVAAQSVKTFPIVPVSYILSDPKEDQPVVVRGYLTDKIGERDYVISDASGRIRVDIKNEFRGIVPNVGSEVEVVGAVKRYSNGPRIRADRISVAQPSSPLEGSASLPLR